MINKNGWLTEAEIIPSSNFDNRPEDFTEEGFVLLSNGTTDLNNWTLVELPEGPFGRNHNKFNHACLLYTSDAADE